MFIKVWCEYPIGEDLFGANSNEDIFEVNDSLTTEQIEKLVVNFVTSVTGESEKELEGLYDWGTIDIAELK